VIAVAFEQLVRASFAWSGIAAVDDPARVTHGLSKVFVEWL
jgi:hypothetical protein